MKHTLRNTIERTRARQVLGVTVAVAVASSVAVASGLAHAQAETPIVVVPQQPEVPVTPAPQASTTPPAATASGDSDDTIVITATPPAARGRRAAGPPGGYGAQSGYGAQGGYGPGPEIDRSMEGGASEQPTTTPTPPTRPVDPSMGYDRIGLIAGSVGVGSPLGYVGVFGELRPHRVFSFGIGAGSGGTFGPALEFHAIVRPVIVQRWALALGLGLSLNFPSNDRCSFAGLCVPGVAPWINPEVGFEYRTPEGFFLRPMIGYTVLLNTGRFTNRWTSSFSGLPMYGPPDSYPSACCSPVTAADAHDEGRALSFFFAHFDIGFAFGGPPVPRPAPPPAPVYTSPPPYGYGYAPPSGYGYGTPMNYLQP